MTYRRFVLVCFMAICGGLCLLLFQGNERTTLVFSRESGFYSESFALEIYAPVGTEIYYTLDGSEPDESAFLYTEPVIIDDATEHENVYCLRTDVVWNGFVEDNAPDYDSYDPKYMVPDYSIDKCTVVRAAYKDADGNFSQTKSASYFVGYDEKKGYDDVNIISIITEPKNLFDYETGIYVFPYGLRGLGNWTMEGIEWERAATIQLFDKEKRLFYDQECGIRIQGGMSRGRLPKSFNLYAREQYSGKGRFYVDLFGTHYMAETVTLFAGGEDVMSKCRDVLVSRLAADRNFAVMHYEPYMMFLDGEYWGFYWLTEKYDDRYFEHYYEVDDDNLVMIKASALAEGVEDDYVLYTDMMEYMTSTDFTIEENYRHACELIDIQSYIDYYVVELYIGHNSDWPDYNEGLWRVRQPGDGKCEDGKWRWFLYDVNSALSPGGAVFDTLSHARNYSAMFDNLCQNEEFRQKFTITLMDFSNTIFTKENVDPVIDECIQLAERPMNVHLKRFFSFEDNSRYLQEMSYIQNFFDERRSYIEQYLREGFGLSDVSAPVTIEVNDAEAGSILVNTVSLTFENGNIWQGKYFTDYPIALMAVPDDGYRFVGWENDVFSENDYIELNLDSQGIYVKAVFEKEE